MYQPYPGNAQLPESQRPPAPASVLTAVKVMYAGAAASIARHRHRARHGGRHQDRDRETFPNLSASQVNASQHTLIIGFVAGGVIAALVWILLARACQRGRNWARITGTVLFAIATLDTIVGLAAPIATRQALGGARVADRADRGRVPVAAQLQRVLQEQTTGMIEGSR